MPATVWKGYLTFGLVSFPIRLFAAARPEPVHFHLLHKKDLSRVKEVMYCAAEDSWTARRSSRVSKVTHMLDRYNNAIDRSDYDWGSGAAGGLLRDAQTSYITGSYTAANPHLLSLPAEVKIYSGSGVLQADTQYGYEATPLTGYSSVAGHDDTNYGGAGTRGNVTSIGRCIRPGSCGWLTTTLYYDVGGNPVAVADANGHTTWYGYGDNYSDGQNRNTYAHLTLETNALGQAEQWQWDYDTGKADGGDRPERRAHGI